MRSSWVGAGVALAGILAAVACGSGSIGPEIARTDGGSVGGGGSGGSGGADAGTGGGGQIDAGTGTDAGTDAGTGSDGGSDGGSDAGTIVSNAQGWKFYQAKDGLTSTQVMGVSADEGGNIWVAGGTSGVFVQRAGSSTFQRYGLADGLHPYGYMPDGGPSDTNPYLEAISISGGPAGTAFVGYMGKPVPLGVKDCESNWDDGQPPDPAIYKSGDADKVSLNGSGINVVHYDIFSGPNVVGSEPHGREKLCNIFRVVYQHGTRYVWFGGNHGFALGFADFAGNPTCDGQLSCAGVWEHVHPAINGWSSDDLSTASVYYLTADYRGVDVDPLSGDVWFGGLIRTTKFRFQTAGGYFNAEGQTQNSGYAWNRMDVWPDKVGEPNYPRPSDRNDDNVWGIAAMPDGSAWIGSRSYGLRRMNSSGAMVDDATSKLLDKHVTALARDPADDSVWIGYPGGYGLGLSQLMPNGSIRHFNASALGNVTYMTVRDIQVDTFSTPHRILVAFEGGVVGVYQPR